MTKNLSVFEIRVALRGAPSSSRVGGGGGGGGHSLRFLAGLTAIFSILLIPHPAEADECGDVSAAKTVTCDAATYGGTSATDANPIEYTGQTGGLTLTVKPSGEMTTIKSFLPDASTRYNGIKVVGRGTLAVKLEGKVSIVNEAGGWTSPTEATFNNGGTEETATFIDPKYVQGSRNYGIWVEGDQAGDSNREDKIEIVIGADAKVGSEEVPIGRRGVFAYYSNTSAEGDVSIVNRGEIHAYYTGIWVFHKGSGDIAVETAEGSVTSKGIRVNVNQSSSKEGGDVRVTNHGTIRSLRQRPLYAKTLTGEVGSKVATSRDRDAEDYPDGNGIKVSHKDLSTGTADKPSSSIMITSSGDIAARWHGIHIDTRGDTDSVVPVTVDVTGGVITAGGRNTELNGDGIFVHSVDHNGGLIKVDLAGEIAWAGSSQGDGIEIRRLVRRRSAARGDINRDTEVTLKPGARIGVEGDEPTVSRNGVNVRQQTHEGTVRVTVSEGAMIGTRETPVGENGVLVETVGSFGVFHSITASDNEVPVQVTNEGFIHAKGSGIYVLHSSWGEVDVKHMAGKIIAGGHGVYAGMSTVYDDPTEAGKIEVTVGEMATIQAKKDGVHVKSKRTFASDHARKGQYDQTVTINGKVMGGAGEHAGVRMVNGGTLVIGPKAEIGATSGTAVRADKALHVTLKENAHGQIAFITGKFLNSGDQTPNVFQRESTAGMTKAIAVDDAVKATSGKTGTHGVYDAVFERMVTLKSIEGGHQFEAGAEKEISRSYHARARVYEALPSVLLEMSGSDGRQARLSATRDGGGAWARALASDGEREAEMSTTAMDTAGHDLSWDFERWGVETGLVVPTDLPGVTLGVSAHYRDGEADVERGGKIEVSGVGVGASATWRGEDGWYADGELSYTRFEDIDLSSETRGMVASGLDGEGHAIGVEVGRRLEMDGFALVPRGGLTWTWVDVDGFADVSGVTGSGRVSFRSEDGVRARIGALLENGQTYASLDVERELSESREAMASRARLRSEVESTWARLGVGGVIVLDERGESTLSGEARYAVSDGDNHDYGASVLLKVRF